MSNKKSVDIDFDFDTQDDRKKKSDFPGVTVGTDGKVAQVVFKSGKRSPMYVTRAQLGIIATGQLSELVKSGDPAKLSKALIGAKLRAHIEIDVN